jgi:hypothetical protein
MSMKSMPRVSGARHLLAALVLALSCSLSSAAQSCALCYTTVAGGGPGVASALRTGILVLLVPPVMLFSALVVVVLRWRTIHTEP